MSGQINDIPEGAVIAGGAPGEEAYEDVEDEPAQQQPGAGGDLSQYNLDP